MASSVFYKFKSQKEESRVTFDGTGISVFDLKKEIILANNLGKANDFDLAIYDGSSNEEYKDDAHIIPRSSSVIVKRLPVRPGKGKAAMYIGGTGTAASSNDPSAKGNTPSGSSNSWHRGTGNISKRFDVKEARETPSTSTPPPVSNSAPDMPKSSVTNDDEAAAMAAMFQAQTANWEETQEKMSHAQRIYTNPRGTGMGRGGRPFQSHHQHQPDRPLPPSYVCYRCGQKGHWIQDCPTNNDREFDNRPRIKRTTGIPRSFLKAVENPSTGKPGQGVMVTPEGGYVVAQPDSISWQKQVARPKGLSEADIRERVPSDSSIVCPIDNKLFREASKTPCCGALYCEECIHTYLLEHDFLCPSCGRKIASLDKLIVDKPMRTKVADYIDKEIEKSRNETEEEVKPNDAPAEAPSGEKDAAAVDVAAFDQEYYAEQQEAGGDMDVAQMLDAQITQLQAQIAQIQKMLNNPTLPPHVRQQTQMKHQQLQMELQQAHLQSQQILVMAAAAATLQSGATQGIPMNNGNMQVYQPQQEYQTWTNPYSHQQPAGQDSAYQRLPVNNRRRNYLKRERPSDFLEVGGSEGSNKVPRYWE